MGQIQLITSLILIGLFTIAVVTFAVNFSIDNDAAMSIADDAEMATLATQVRNNVSGFSDDANNQYSSILNTTISPGSDVPQSIAPFAITPLNAFGVLSNILEVEYTKIFGNGTGFGIFLTTFLGLILFIIGLFVYKTLKGLPD